jgi:hypothetical protein
MGKKKKGGAAAATGTTAPASKVKAGKDASADEKKVTAGPGTIWGMALGGGFLGMLSGLNQWPRPPVALTTQASGASWMGYVLGVQGLDYTAAAQGALLGLLVGAGFAVSFFFRERKMLACWLLAGTGLIVAALTLKTATAAAGGWLLGWMLAMTVKDAPAR